MDRNVYIGREGCTETSNPAGQTPNPAALSKMHGASISKGLDDLIPATSHTSLGLVSSTLYMHLSMAGVS